MLNFDWIMSYVLFSHNRLFPWLLPKYLVTLQINIHLKLDSYVQTAAAEINSDILTE